MLSSSNRLRSLVSIGGREASRIEATVEPFRFKKDECSITSAHRLVGNLKTPDGQEGFGGLGDLAQTAWERTKRATVRFHPYDFRPVTDISIMEGSSSGDPIFMTPNESSTGRADH
jgi:hypothetical protein